MAVLARVDSQGRLTGTFKCCIVGTGPTTFHIPADKIFDNPPPKIHQLNFEVSADLEEMSPPANATSTRWKDFTDSINDRTVLVTNKDGSVENPKPVLEYLRSLSSQKTPGGYSTRWAVGATSSSGPTTFQMEFQVLPAPAEALNKQNLQADNCISVLATCIPLQVELFDGKVATGPVPTLFAANTEAASMGLQNNAAFTLEDIKRLNSRFSYMEHLTMDDAVVYLHNHSKKGKGVVDHPSPEPTDQPSAKRSKAAVVEVPCNPQEMETGTFY
jgi:hypothetical protein